MHRLLIIIFLMQLYHAHANEDNVCVKEYQSCQRSEYVLVGEPGLQGPPGSPGPGCTNNCNCADQIIQLKSQIVDIFGQIQSRRTANTPSAAPLTIDILPPPTTNLPTSTTTSCTGRNRAPNVVACSSELGAKYGGILPDDAFSASSESSMRGASIGRLNLRFGPGNLGAWLPWPYANSWLQVDLRVTKYISGVITQGNDNFRFYTKSYQIKYGTNENNLEYVMQNNLPKIFFGNSDNNTPVRVTFPTTVLARYVRIYPLTYQGGPYLRIEILGCDAVVC